MSLVASSHAGNTRRPQRTHNPGLLPLPTRPICKVLQRLAGFRDARPLRRCSCGNVLVHGPEGHVRAVRRRCCAVDTAPLHESGPAALAVAVVVTGGFCWWGRQSTAVICLLPERRLARLGVCRDQGCSQGRRGALRRRLFRLPGPERRDCLWRAQEGDCA